jgi:fructosamine-3-kinase
MTAMPDWTQIAAAVRDAGGPRLEAAGATPVGGGCIHAAWRVPSAEGPCFVKLGDVEALPALEAEARGLDSLVAARAVRVPRIRCCTSSPRAAVLVLEWIELRPRNGPADEQLGARLARQHRVLGPAYGAADDNFIGLTPQPNGWQSDWVAFLRERRLGFQLEFAARNGYRALIAPGERLLARLEAFFPGDPPPPSLLHGDLWGGNAAADPAGQPVIFDPAVYHGDREADIAMTRLFGGFGQAFHAAYAQAWPLADGHRERVDLYNLYHVLNHLNLFGTAYLGQAAALLRGLAARAG